MAEKKTTSNKGEKKPTASKAKKPKRINYSELSDMVDIVAIDGRHMEIGKAYTVTKDTAIILIEKGAAELK